MTDFLIRSIDPDLLEKLKVRAERHGRSLQAEIKHTLKQSVKLGKSESLELLKRLRGEVPYSPIDSTQLIREDRDSR